MPCHCLLIESSHGLILVDTGLGTADINAKQRRLGHAFHLTTRPRLDERECAVHQIRRLGYRPQDVRHIVLTHLDLDHAGGLPDFPHARVHVYAPEHQAAFGPNQSRYVKAQFGQVQDWAVYEDFGEAWFGFDCVRQLQGLPPDILLIPLVGHTAGSAGIAVSTGERWILHCGDAYFHHSCVRPSQEPMTKMLRLVSARNQYDEVLRLRNVQRLRNLVETEGHQVDVFCSHDPVEFEYFHRSSPLP